MAAGGNISKNQSQSSRINYHSKEVSELFPTDPISSYFILIEGAPGIGKTVLCKEIACQWAENKLLKFKELVFLLYLRDPAITNMVMLEHLTQYVLNNSKKGSELSDHLFETKGKDLTIIFDGYDEMSEEDRKNSLVAKIISRKVLPECDLVITSRPTASLHLRDIADCRVEVLGFTEEDRLDYIKYALEGSLEKIEFLQSYLRSNTTINALCYIPLNMTILLCLYEDMVSSQINTLNIDSIKKIGLPTTQTEMYKNFILMTVTRCINKSNNTFSSKYLEITELPKPYNEVFNELLHLAYHALIKDKIVFNSDEEVMQKFCKYLKSGNCDGLGLLKVTRHVKTVSFHFLHFSIQEYMAAYYIASQSNKFQVQLLRDTFWDIHYFNTWIMYVGMTGGKRVAWKHFVSGNWFMLFTKIFKSSKISKKYLNDKIKSLHLFQCYAEIGNNELVKTVFEDKVIDLSNRTLLPKDINTICFFLLRSANKHWIKLDLHNCNIGITGSDVLCKTFLDKSRDVMSIDKVDLSCNQLQSQSILELLDVLRLWRASEAVIYDTYDYKSNLFELCLNKFPLFEDEFSHALLIGPYIFARYVDMHNKLTNSANLITGLYLNYCNYSACNIKYEKLRDKLNLSKLHIIGENIPCYCVGNLVQTIKEVDSVYIYDHTLSNEDVQSISLMIRRMSLSNLGVWIVIGSTKILGNIPDLLTLNEKLPGMEALNFTKSIEILCSKSEMCTGKFNEHTHTDSKSIFGNLFNVLHDNIFKCEITFCLMENNILIANGVKYDKIKEVLFSYSHLVSICIANCKLIATELSELISKQKSLEKLYISVSSLDIHNLKYENLLNRALRLKELFMHTTNSSSVFNFDLLKAKECYPNISVSLLTNDTLIGHNPTCEQILLSLKLEPNLTTLRINHFPINPELLQKSSNSLSTVIDLDIVDFTYEEQRLQDNNQSDDVQHNLEKNSKLAISNIGEVLSYFPKLEALNFSHNDLQEAGTAKIFEYLNVSNLNSLNISCNEINKQVVDDIAKLLSQISMLKGLDLSCNNLQATEAVKLLSEVENISSCTKLNINNSDINGKAARCIATFVCNNTLLKELNLSHSNLLTEDAIIICNAMSNIQCLTKLNISNNGIDGEATDDIAVVLSQNILLEDLDISYNNLGAICSLHICHAMKRLSSLIKLNLCSIGLTDNAANDIGTVLNNNIKLQDLNLSHNNLQATGATTVFKMASNKNLHTFNISHNNINDDVEFLEVFLSANTNLKELDFSHNNLQATGIKKVCKTNLTILEKFDISHNGITIDAADDLGAFLACNCELQQINLSGNKLEKSGYECVFEHLQLINLISLQISYSSHVNEAIFQLADFLFQKGNLQEIDLSHNSFSALDTVIIFDGMANISNLVTIDVSHNIINYEGGDQFAAVLSHNIRLKDINLSYTNLSTVAAINIFKGMKNISHLITINISHNMITDEAAKDIAFVLTRNNNLQSLNLSCNCFTSKGFVSIFNCLKKAIYLRKLNVSLNEFNIEAAHSIGTVLSHNTKLEELDLSNTCLNTSAAAIIFKNLRHSLNLKKIYINGNMITDEAADDIAVVLTRNNKLQSLNLSCNCFTSKGFVSIFNCLKKTIYLRKLNVSLNEFNIEAAHSIGTVLSHNTKLEELDLSNTCLNTSAAAIIFKNLRHSLNLKKIYINGNMITDEAADDIAVVLTHNNKLQSLDLSYNCFTSEGFVSIFNCLKTAVYLRKLNVGSNEFNIKAAHSVGTVLSHNTKLEELDLSNSCMNTPAAAIIFKSLRHSLNLKKIYFNGNMITDEAADDIAVVLSQNNKLEELDISYNYLQTAGILKIFAGIKHISSLSKLDIAHNMAINKAEVSIIDGLSSKSKLKELNLSHTNLKYAINSKDSKHSNFLSQCPNLQVLNLSCTNLQEAGFVKMLNKIDLFNLIKFDISGNSITTNTADNIAVLLSKSNELEDLNLSCNNLRESGIGNILNSINILNLSSLNISDNHITGLKYIADILTHATKLVELDVSYNKISAESMMYFLHEMAGIFVNLVKLNLSGNIFSNKVAESLADALLKNTILIELSLSDNNLHVERIRKIFGKLKISTLIKFRINHSNITDEAVDCIATFLSKNTKLEELDLSHNNLLSDGAIKICWAKLSKLTSFNISHNGITANAAEDLAAFLSRNTELQQLDLSHNSLLSCGIKIICKINLSKLTTINIGHNGITVEATDVIADFLNHNTKLKFLDISCSDLQETGCRNIFKVLQNVSTLTALKVINCNINAVDELSIVLHNNIFLRELDLSCNNLSKSNFFIILQKMKNISNLTKLDVSHNMITDEVSGELETVLLCNSSLQQLDLGHNNFSLSSVVNMLKNLSNLLRINISYTRITNTTVNSLVDFLICNPSLKEINLSSNHISTSNAIKIFNGMENISNLEVINISNNMITDDAAESIATVLSHNNKLKSLNLSSNYLRSEGFIKIFNGMRKIAYLKKLIISSNEITALNAIDCIAKFLFQNLELEILDLSNSFIQKAGIIKIFEKMRKISSLRKINVYGNVITKEAADVIASVLSQNTKLEELNIGYTNLPTEGALKIFRSIMHISTLTSFNIAHNTITNEAARYVVSILRNNNKLRELNLSHSEIILFDLSKCNFTNLHELDLSYTNLQTASSIKKLNILALKKFSFSANQISASELNSLANFLYENDELQQLDLSVDNLQEVSAKSILNFKNFVNVLNYATKLVELDLSYNKFSSTNLDYIFCTAKSIFVNIIRLNLSGNEICNGAVNALANALAENSKLKELILCDANIQSEEISKIFGKLRFPHLTKLSISHNYITDEAADVIAEFISESHGLEELDVSYNNLKSSGIIKICKINLSKLTVFNLSHNSITIKAAADIASFLSHNSELQVLDISCNDLEIGCRNIFTSLQSLMVLSVLKLTNCHLINEITDELTNVLLHSTLLQELDISCNNLETSSAINIFKGMKNISYLVAINISHNMITDEATEDLAFVLSCNIKLQSLDLSYNCFTSEILIKIFELKCLKNTTYLKKFNFSSNKINVKAALGIGTVLSCNLMLEELDLSNNCMQTPAATIVLKNLRESSNLKKISINDNLITKSDAIKIFKGMKNISKLKTINISHNMIDCGAADELATVLSHNNNLQSLDLSYNDLRSEGCIKIMNKMINLKKIDVSYNQITSEAADSIAAFLSHITELETLIISGNDFHKSFLFKKFTVDLTLLDISSTLLEVDDIATVLMHNTKLEDIDLSNNELLSSSIITICHSMKNILNLKRIDISHNCVNYEAADDIANVLSQNVNLQELYLNNNYLESKGIITLFSKMSTNVKLTHLNISSNEINDEATDDIATFLLHNGNLKVLNLSNNLIQTKGARKIFEKATTIFSLNVLNLSRNALDDESTDAIVTFILQNPLLEEFSISENYLQAVGAVKIFKAIQNCPSILKVNMSNNQITDEAGDEIASVLSTITKLREVDLTYNKLSTKTSENIRRAFINLPFETSEKDLH